MSVPKNLPRPMAPLPVRASSPSLLDADTLRHN
jgi:hypothetical protein